MAITLPSDDGQPLFVELEGHLKTIKPAVQTIYDLLGTVERLWRANGADMILAATKPDAVPLGQGSTTAGEWLEYQRLFRALREWIESPVVLAAATARSESDIYSSIICRSRFGSSFHSAQVSKFGVA